MALKIGLKAIIIIFWLFFGIQNAQGAVFTDADDDGIADSDEINIYKTDPKKKDTDGDGHSDWLELNRGYSPLNNKSVKLADNDADNDGLTDSLELKFKSDIKNGDTDGDGIPDGKELAAGYDPASKSNRKLAKTIKIDKKNQILTYFYDEVKIGEFRVSTGKGNSTPKGEFKISNKSFKAWSPYGLWMPYWMGLGAGKFGIHELPVWPNGYREGENHLGRPVSHGCIRLGVGAAKQLYAWAEIGTKVVIN